MSVDCLRTPPVTEAELAIAYQTLIGAGDKTQAVLDVLAHMFPNMDADTLENAGRLADELAPNLAQHMRIMQALADIIDRRNTSPPKPH